VRARKGAGGRFSLKSNTINEALLWMKLWVTKGLAKWSDFIIEEFLPGRNIAWDSLWFNGKLITSFARERLEYIYPSLAPSGITGTPTVARIIHDKKVNEISEASVRALDKKPHGFFCVDLKENDLGVPCVTEVNVGKFHTTGSLWSYAAIKGLRLPWFYNLSYLYVQIAFQGDVPKENIQQCDIYPEGVYLLRHIDCGAWLYRDDGWKVKIL
jgi:carbamoyl-phosphate synthase large subunit